MNKIMEALLLSKLRMSKIVLLVVQCLMPTQWTLGRKRSLALFFGRRLLIPSSHDFLGGRVTNVPIVGQKRCNTVTPCQRLYDLYPYEKRPNRPLYRYGGLTPTFCLCPNWEEKASIRDHEQSNGSSIVVEIENAKEIDMLVIQCLALESGHRGEKGL